MKYVYLVIKKRHDGLRTVQSVYECEEDAIDACEVFVDFEIRNRNRFNVIGDDDGFKSEHIEGGYTFDDPIHIWNVYRTSRNGSEQAWCMSYGIEKHELHKKTEL